MGRLARAVKVVRMFGICQGSALGRQLGMLCGDVADVATKLRASGSQTPEFGRQEINKTHFWPKLNLGMVPASLI